MKLQYTEHRTTTGSDHVEILGRFTDGSGFTDALIKDVKVCLTDDAHDLAHKLIDWHREVTAVEANLKPGAKLVHNYGTGLDPVGTWEIIA